jgi:putative transposase
MAGAQGEIPCRQPDIRGHIDELFAQDRPLPEILEEVARLGAQLLMQAALEAEVTEFLGRDRYQRAALIQDARPGSRNGYREVTVKTTAGPVALARPKLRGTSEAFASRLFGSHVTKTNALESLVIASFVRGLSVRDVEATLAGALGDQAAVSKSTVSAICQQIKDEYEAWARRRLDGVKLDYLSWTPASSGCTRARRPSRCWPPGASPPRVSPPSSAWALAPASPSTRGRTSSPASRSGAWPARC